MDEFEISIFGPGYGECIVMHVGQHRWVIVDSCIDTSEQDDRRPVAEKYLRALNVDLASQVDLIVATHWHADHIRGIGRLVEQCRSATFSCAQAMLRLEFVAFVEEMSTGSVATDGAKLTDFREALHCLNDRGMTVRWASGNRVLMTWPNATDASLVGCELRSLSPSDREFNLFLQHIAGQMPQHGAPKRSAAAQTPNLASVVLHLRHGSFSVLLGADMETHHEHGRGWNAVLQEAQLGNLPRADLQKIPHHGSATGHHDQVWATLLEASPVSIVTPFNRLPEARKLPTNEDVGRIAHLSGRFYATSPARRGTTRGRDPAVERSLRESNIVIKPTAAPLGLVRSRRLSGATEWLTEVFPPAYEIQNMAA